MSLHHRNPSLLVDDLFCWIIAALAHAGGVIALAGARRVGMARHGTRAQVKATWSVAKEDAKISASFAEESISRELAAAVETAPLFADPPMPNASAASIELDQDDVDALRKLRDDPAAGFSPAGLPRRVLAGIFAFEQSRDPADEHALMTLATVEAPSILTPVILGKTNDKHWQARWAMGDDARAQFREHPEVDANGKWLIGQHGPWWLASDGKALRFLTPAALAQTLDSAAKRLPAWADLRISLGGNYLSGSSASGDVMQSLPLRFGSDLRLEILAARPALFEASARQQARWTLGLLTCPRDPGKREGSWLRSQNCSVKV